MRTCQSVPSSAEAFGELLQDAEPEWTYLLIDLFWSFLSFVFFQKAIVLMIDEGDMQQQSKSFLDFWRT